MTDSSAAVLSKLLPRQLDSKALAAVLGIEVVTIEPGVVSTRMKVDLVRHANPLGAMHGGVITTLADHAMGIAFISLLGGQEVMTTIELKMNLLAAPADGDMLTATAKVVKFGRTVGYAEAEVVSASGKLIARGSSSVVRLAAR